MAYPSVSRLGTYRRVRPCLQDSMTEITGPGARPACDLRQTILGGFRSTDVCAVAQYRSHIAELSGFARARCPSDAY
ncbi:hypothetical protein GCM10010297_03890 [Streptomyces malachitofuscus]|nr:hypothetical protein GCM10010297_03890 [Streptomyces malachitofuscus]